MKHNLEAFHKAFSQWAEENEPIQPTEDDASSLLEALDEADITVLPKDSISELRLAAKQGYQWPAPMGFPANLPAAECEQYYCLTERFPKEAVLQMWGDGENAPEWCEWDGDSYIPTSHKVLAFWPMPVPSAESTYRAATPTPAASVLVGEAEGGFAKWARAEMSGYYPTASEVEWAERAFNAALAARPAPLSLLGSGDAAAAVIARDKSYIEDIRAYTERLRAENLIKQEFAQPWLPRLQGMLLRYDELCAALSAAASTGGGAGQGQPTSGDLYLFRMDLMAAQLGASTADTNYEIATVLKAANQKAIDKISSWLTAPAAPQHLVVGEAAATGQWISVDERLPDDRVRVCITRPLSLHSVDDSNRVHIGYQENGGWYALGEDYDGDALLDNTVTHWQPLPAAPADEAH